MTNGRSLTGMLARLGAGVMLATVSQTVPVPAQLSYEVSSSPDVVVLQLTEDVGIRGGDDTPRVRVYGDRRVAVHFPAYIRRAGDYELRLSEPVVQELFTMAVGALLPFDAAATGRRQRRARQPHRLRVGGAARSRPRPRSRPSVTLALAPGDPTGVDLPPLAEPG